MCICPHLHCGARFRSCSHPVITWDPPPAEHIADRRCFVAAAEGIMHIVAKGDGRHFVVTLLLRLFSSAEGITHIDAKGDSRHFISALLPCPYLTALSIL